MKAFKIKRGNETYYRVELPQQLCPNGKRRSVTAKTRAEAIAKAEQEVERHAHGLERNGGDKTVVEFLTEFLAYYKRDGGVAYSTWQDYRYHTELHITPELGNVKLRELDVRGVDRFLGSMSAKGLSIRTCSYAHSVLRRALQFAVDWRYIPFNPASARMRAARRRQVREVSKIQFLNPEQARASVAAVRGETFEALYVLAITTGMRQGEMLGLQWSDLDLNNDNVKISRSLRRTHRRRDAVDGVGWFELANPKTPGSRRNIDIPAVTVQALLEHREKQRLLRRLAGSTWKEHNLVFTTGHGSPVDTTNILHRFHQILETAGLPKIRFYDLRRTHASLLIAEGVHLKKIAERLGHASIKLTMDLYGHLFEGSDKESADRMQRLFGDAGASQPQEKGNVVSLPVRKKRA